MKKKTLHIIFAIIILVVGPNAYADGTKGKKDQAAKKEKAEKVIDRISGTIDADLNLENWMIEISAFNNKESFYEENLRLENWMTNVFVVETESFNEKEMVLEDWMTKTFKVEAIDVEMEMEEWMLEPFNTSENDFQEKELALEDWMLKF